MSSRLTFFAVAATAAAVAGATAIGAGAAAAKNGAFKTPSGNIVCGYGFASARDGSIECGIRSGLKPPPTKRVCSGGDYTDKRVSLRSTGRAVPVVCAGDPGPFLVASSARVLAYGSSWHGGGITCTSRRTGLTCRNRTGHGFFLSRQSWRSF